MSGATAKLTPEAKAKRRMQNVAQLWNERTRAVGSDAELARLCWDRARAAARRAQRGGERGAMHELAELLARWAEQKEKAEIARHAP
ncbi:hypothetical protein ACFFMN_34095 [Planobispora siamensis]|uniref:Uncharacterized protein n=1 Tax=Planobispora siamensis TaxID=936338 RepID=A0A8J3SH18_9ACTN|nr:hypothetical protein [Planobispora siamensis]GIH91914.1 hypothetical protein Psi01_25440 [Planobispora siamensis]